MCTISIPSAGLACQSHPSKIGLAGDGGMGQEPSVRGCVYSKLGGCFCMPKSEKNLCEIQVVDLADTESPLHCYGAHAFENVSMVSVETCGIENFVISPLDI